MNFKLEVYYSSWTIARFSNAIGLFPPDEMPLILILKNCNSRDRENVVTHKSYFKTA